jgi:hypothetical protein
MVVVVVVVGWEESRPDPWWTFFASLLGGFGGF